MKQTEYTTRIKPFPNYRKSDGTQNFQDAILSCFFDDTNLYNITSAMASLQLQGNWWRPDPAKLMSIWQNISTPHEILIKLANMIFYTDSIKDDEILQYLSSNKYIRTNKLVNLSKSIFYPSIPPSKIIDQTFYTHYKGIKKDLFDGILINTIEGMPFEIRTEPQLFHYGNEQLINNQQNQVIHTVVIDQNRDIGYKFRFDCCRIDLLDYFQSSKFKSGVALNASFFKIKSDYRPVGFFKTTDVVIDNPIPVGYEKYYGIIGINRYGKLVIDTYDKRNRYDKVTTAGALLIYDGNILITDEKLASEQDSTGKLVFQCKDPNNTGSKMDTDQVISCMDIRNGSLEHASNLNPRTAIAIDETGVVMFVIIEGRDQKGSGMDLSQLAQYCAINNAKYAINLDGGRSSQLVWKKEGEDIIRSPFEHPEYDKHYPVGSIISYVKES